MKLKEEICLLKKKNKSLKRELAVLTVYVVLSLIVMLYNYYA